VPDRSQGFQFPAVTSEAKPNASEAFAIQSVLNLFFQFYQGEAFALQGLLLPFFQEIILSNLQ
jgi:hypothetical protein